MGEEGKPTIDVKNETGTAEIRNVVTDKEKDERQKRNRDYPEGWMIVGYEYRNEKQGIVGELDKSPGWIKTRIKRILKEIPETEQPDWVKQYPDESGRYIYSSKMIGELKRMADEENKALGLNDNEALLPAPQYWRPKGVYTLKGSKSGIAGSLKRSSAWVDTKINKILEGTPDEERIKWTGKFMGPTGPAEYYSEEIYTQLKKLAEEENKAWGLKEGEELPPPPKDWKFRGNERNGITVELDKSRSWIDNKIENFLKNIPREEHPKWIMKCRGTGGVAEYCSKVLYIKLKKMAEEEKKAWGLKEDERLELPPKKWKSLGREGVSKEIQKSEKWILRKVNFFLEFIPEKERGNWVKKYKGPGGAVDYCSEELYIKLKKMAEEEKKIKEEKRLEKKLKEFPTPPDNWKYSVDILKEIKRSKHWWKRKVKELLKDIPENEKKTWTKKCKKEEKRGRWCSEELYTQLKKLAEEENKAWGLKEGEELPPPPKDWKPRSDISKNLHRSDHWIVGRIKNIPEKEKTRQTGKFMGPTGPAEYYSEEIYTQLKKLAEEENKAWGLKEGEELPPPPKDWKPSYVIAVEINKSVNWVLRNTREILKDKPAHEKEKWAKKCKSPESGGVGDYYSVNFVAELKKLATLEDEGDIIGEIRAEDEEKARKFIEEIAEGKTPLAQEIRALIKCFSASRCIDILYKYHPEFKEVSVDYIHSLLGKYLGDFLITRTSFNPEAVKKMPPGLLSEKKFYDDFYEVTKDDCLRYYFAKRREAKDMEPIDIIYEYINHRTASLGEARSKEVDDVIEAVISYYDSALRDFKKPEKFVDSLTTDREFPDINQKINMKELADKKRLLIADEMGLGKSASVIMAKEHMGVGCALITAPRNVIETWKKYLSNADNGGYFKSGLEPKILEVTNPEELKNISPGQYDYILISHGKLNQRYMEALDKVAFDMLVVDESHMLKNLKGKRTERLEVLAAKVQGENQYLALLSGTPVPNKVQDLAIILKLIHPDKFKDLDDRQLTKQIINGKIHKLRDLLVPHMQMKSLEESVDMPEFTESTQTVELSEAEKDLSRVIMEDDELTSMQKIKLLRQLTLNPRIAEATPDIKSSKALAANEKIKTAFERKNRVVMFVNDYVNGVIRGETTIMDQFDLPPDIKILVIHGKGVTSEDRTRFQSQFNAKNSEKILLIVSGKTSDVGVDFTGGEEVIFYNEPWTQYQKRQEKHRVFRQGLDHEVEATTLIARGTIEEGIHEYIGKKFIAIEKLLRGVDNSDYEKRLLAADEDNPGTLEKNSELAEYFLSSIQKLRKMFGIMFEMGEKEITRFVTEFGQEYAQGYTDMGSRNHQANANRMVGILIDRFASHEKQLHDDVRILDLASGPSMLKKHITDAYQKRVVSMDINRHHFNDTDQAVVVGGMAHIPFRDQSFEYVTSALAWQDTTFVPGQRNFERIKVLHEANRVLKPNGRLVITLPYSIQLLDPEKFSEAIHELGFKVIPDYTGVADQGEHFAAQVITLEKVTDCEPDLEKVAEKIGSDKMKGFKFESTATKIRNSKKIITNFTLNKEIIDVELNTDDQYIKKLEDKYVTDGLLLKNKYSGIKNIPEDELVKFGFVRYKRVKTYGLFKKMPGQNGYILVR